MSKLQTNLGFAARMNKVCDAFPLDDMLWLYIPVQPGVILPSRVTFVISVKSRPAPPTARLPRWTRCQSFGVPSSAEYIHMGDNTIRLTSSMSLNLKGVNIGGGGGSVMTPDSRANHRSCASTNFGSLSLRFECVMRRLRVKRLKAKTSGGMVPKMRSVSSNHFRLTSAALWVLWTTGRRSASYSANAC